MAAFADLYRQYVRQVYRFMLTLSGNESEAEEMTQETFYRAFLNIDKFEGRCSLYTWLCRIGKNTWIQYNRKKKTLSLYEAENRYCDADISEQAERREKIGAVRRAIMNLPEPYREVLIYRTYGQISFKEIAAMAGKTESWAKVTYFRGKEKLRKELGEYENEL